MTHTVVHTYTTAAAINNKPFISNKSNKITSSLCLSVRECICVDFHLCVSRTRRRRILMSPSQLLITRSRGATTAEKLRGTKVWVRSKAGLSVGCGRGSPSPVLRVWGVTSRKFLKTQMLNPAF